MAIKTTAKRTETEPPNRLLRQTTWLVTVETDVGAIFEAIMVFREQPSAEDMLYFYQRRPEMFREQKQHQP